MNRPSFPPEIFCEILLKVPSESLLLRCKPVCKEWYALISDQDFIKSHYKLSSTNYQNHSLICKIEYSFVRTMRTMGRPLFPPDFLPVKSLMRCKSNCDYGNGQPCLISCPLNDALFHQSITNNHMCLKCPLPPTWGTAIVGSCNGLMCIDEGLDLFIYNPTTRRSNLLPSTSRPDYYHGFGYDELSDDYKVLKISNDPESRPNLLYSLKTGKWKDIGHFSCGGPMLNHAKFLNGALHWAGGYESDLGGYEFGSWKIVSLHLANETYGEVLPPEYHERSDYLDLGVLGEWLSVLCNYSNIGSYVVDVWVMKVYGVKDSWTKLASIPNPHSTVGRVVSPLCISQDGKLLLQFINNLVVYDLKDGSSSVIDKECSDTCIVVKSLVSPFPPLGLADNNDDED